MVQRRGWRCNEEQKSWLGEEMMRVIRKLADKGSHPFNTYTIVVNP